MPTESLLDEITVYSYRKSSEYFAGGQFIGCVFNGLKDYYSPLFIVVKALVDCFMPELELSSTDTQSASGLSRSL